MKQIKEFKIGESVSKVNKFLSDKTNSKILSINPYIVEYEVFNDKLDLLYGCPNEIKTLFKDCIDRIPNSFFNSDYKHIMIKHGAFGDFAMFSDAYSLEEIKGILINALNIIKDKQRGGSISIELIVDGQCDGEISFATIF